MIRLAIVEKLSQQYLADTTLPIGDIALELGYSEPSAFNRAFKRIEGITPREYRNNNQQ